ncbi:cupin domain-containing protein [Nonomuraea jabiensis]|uniref:Mannose-6-phosphate isomerase-like protein (Cupin superfamily) n=1 Tax=Nonomuraea jabiensis TaxID=882448 RepID=A0A7W9GCZ8_9ACTN|nr:cupin domain-containing protein [Nonomuraea jabiensis]MBB5781518.1 mannose-6-phosphate isomerase-like protein (cupin superfamily) [Nonomuraea jabiensis]
MTPLFPGGTSISDLAVYDWECADGVHGGTPHLHTVSTEAYVVTAGRGEVHTLSAAGFARDRLEAGTVLWFSPGTIHRLVNEEDLRLVVIMQNAGLPEAGDAVLTFPTDVLRDRDAYLAAATLPAQGSEDERAAAARARRDLAITGFRQLLEAVEERGEQALADFHRLAAAIVRPRAASWKELWDKTVAAETERTREQLVAIASGDPAHLGQATVVRTTSGPEPRAFGMCGRLRTWTPLPSS